MPNKETKQEQDSRYIWKEGDFEFETDEPTKNQSPTADFVENGGSGSGNFGHAGRPGKRGGSSGEGGKTGKGATAPKPISPDKAKWGGGASYWINPKGELFETAQDGHTDWANSYVGTDRSKYKDYTTYTYAGAEKLQKEGWAKVRADSVFSAGGATSGIHSDNPFVGLNKAQRAVLEMVAIRHGKQLTHDGGKREARVLYTPPTDNQFTRNYVQKEGKNLSRSDEIVGNGGSGSGNFGHEGRPGKRGGSGERGGSSGEGSTVKATKTYPKLTKQQAKRVNIDKAASYLKVRGISLGAGSWDGKQTSYEITDKNGKKAKVAATELQRILTTDEDTVVGNIRITANFVQKEGSGYVVKSSKGKNLSRKYKSKGEATKRLQQIEAFRQMR